MTQNGCLKRPVVKTAGATVYLMEELGDARMRCDQLVRYVDEATKLLENASADEKEHLFEAAGHLVQSIPGTLFKLQKALQAVALAATRIDYEELKDELKPEKVEQLEKVLQDVRIRHVQRRSQPWTIEQASALKSLARQASMLLGDLETMERTAGEWKVGHDWTGHLGAKGAMNKSKVKSWMQQNLKRYVDRKTDEANTTQMAEEAASEFDLYEGNDIPEEVFELAQDVAEKGGHGVRLAAKRPTFDEARKVLWDYLKEKGWKLSSPDLKVSHATSPDGEVRLWFKTQAVYMSIVKGRGLTHTLQGARSIHVDIRDLSPEQFMSKVQSWSKDASWKASSEESKESKFEEGKPADPTENMSPEDAKKWKAQTEEHKDEFKAAAQMDAGVQAQFEAAALAMRAASKGQRVKTNVVGAVRSITTGLALMNEERASEILGRAADTMQASGMWNLSGKEASGTVDVHKLDRMVTTAEHSLKEMHHALDLYKRDPGKYAPQLDNFAAAVRDLHGMGQAVLRSLGKTAAEDSKESKFEEGKPADPTKNMSPEDAKKWKAQTEEHKDEFKAASGREKHLPGKPGSTACGERAYPDTLVDSVKDATCYYCKQAWEKSHKAAACGSCETSSDDSKESKFEEGKPADPTENMSPEDAAKWKSENEKNKDRFKAASAWKV